MSLHNVGDYLLEVPTELVKRVPKDWQKVRVHLHVVVQARGAGKLCQSPRCASLAQRAGRLLPRSTALPVSLHL